ncbi:anti-sigma factor family protein [Acidovorax radicis]|uniref:anti-sigma factor family protein n=1 Tax=Acidovorax radicis TaxID=758826 RepID=UPI00031DD65A|nr:anti-sigma factor [Acidovorax radicis]
MDTPRHAPPSRKDDPTAWHALVDGQLPPAEAEALRQQLQGDGSALDAITHWQTQRTRLHALHQDLLHEPVPDGLLATALRAVGRKEQQAQWWRWGGMAASVLVAFVLGWAGRSEWSRHGPGRSQADTSTQVATAPVQRFAQQAAVAHAVYQPEVRHPVEVTAAQQEHLVQWLSKRLGRPLKLPVLAAEGYELVGGRLLPGDTGARAQFMYQNSQGDRITLYLGAIATLPAPQSGTSVATPTAPPNREEIAFQFTSDGPVPGFYWAEQGFGYSLSGQLSRQTLLTLAATVHRQL